MSSSLRLDQGSLDTIYQNLTVQNLTVTGTQTVTTTQTINGDMTIGDESGDTLTINATLGSSFALGGNALTNAGDITVANGSALRTGTTLSDTLTLDAYDTNAASYTTLITLTAGNPPTLDVHTDLDLNGNSLQNAAIAQSVNNVTASGSTTTLANADAWVFVDSSSNTETINLPATPSTGQSHTIRRDGSNNVTVDGNGANVQEGTSAASTFVLDTDAQRVTFVYDGTIWRATD